MEQTLREKARDFVESETFGKLSKKWIFSTHDSFIHATVLGVSAEWVNAKWENCEEIEIYKTLIRKARQKLYTIMTEEDEEYVKEILKDNQRKLYEELTCNIYEYCVR